MKSLALFMTLGVSLEGWKKGGWLRRELALYEEHARNGVRIFLVSYGGDEDLKIARDFPELTVLINEYRLPKRLYAALLPYLHFQRLKGVDLIKTNQLMGAKQAVTAARLLGVPVVVRQGYSHVEFKAQAKGIGSRRYRQAIAYERKWLRKADLCQYTTENAKAGAVERLGADNCRHVVIPNYVVDRLWEPTFHNFREVKANDTFRLGFWGRLAKQKNLENLVAACSGLNVELVLAGEGSERRAIEQRAQSMRVGINFLGQIPHEKLARSMAECDAFIIASHLEGHPKALIEAMFFGMPIIAVDSPGIKPLVVDGETAMVGQTSIASLKSLVQRARSLSAPERRQLAANARNFAHSVYSLKAVARRELEIYEQLLHRNDHDWIQQTQRAV